MIDEGNEIYSEIFAICIVSMEFDAEEDMEGEIGGHVGGEDRGRGRSGLPRHSWVVRWWKLVYIYRVWLLVIEYI